MTTQRGSGGGQDPVRSGAQLYEAGYQALFEGWRQAQEFWNGVARTWGGAAGAWAQPGGRSNETMDVMRELNEAAFAVAQAWMRLPLTLMGGSQPEELQEAVTRLAAAQGRAFELWMEALNRASGAVTGAPGGADDGSARGRR